MARRRQMDVRWDPEFVDRAQAAASALGVNRSELVRRAAALGLELATAALRAERGLAGGPVARVSRAAGAALERLDGSADGAGRLPGAGTAPLGGGASDSSPRPGPARPPAPRGLVKLAVAVARSRVPAGPIPPADGAWAVRTVERGGVRVDGVVVVDPHVLVDPRLVVIA